MSCARKANLLKQGKKKFGLYIETDIKDVRSLEFISFIAKEFVEEVVEECLIKRDVKLAVHSYPIDEILIEEVSENLLARHLSKLNKRLLKMKSQKKLKIEVCIDSIKNTVHVILNNQMLTKNSRSNRKSYK